MKLPWFPCYAMIWLTDSRVSVMSLEEQGAYHRLLCWQWVNGFVRGDSLSVQAALGGRVSVRRATALWAKLSKFFDPMPGYPDMLQNARLEEERATESAHRPPIGLDPIETCSRCRGPNDRADHNRKTCWKCANADAARRTAENRSAEPQKTADETATAPQCGTAVSRASDSGREDQKRGDQRREQDACMPLSAPLSSRTDPEESQGVMKPNQGADLRQGMRSVPDDSGSPREQQQREIDRLARDLRSKLDQNRAEKRANRSAK